MDAVISEYKLDEYGLKIQEALLLKSLRCYNNISGILESLQEKDLITGFVDGNIELCTITSRGNVIADDVISKAKQKNKHTNNDERIEHIAKMMMSEYPQGYKMTQDCNGVWVKGKPWIGSLSKIKDRISNFERDFNIELDAEKAANAVRKYVNVETRKDPTYRKTMRILPYFIYKNNESDFLDYYESDDNTEETVEAYDESNGMTIL